ncbi:MAG: helix-hairpin-helix domain-containing protein [Methylococcales bacterium]
MLSDVQQQIINAADLKTPHLSSDLIGQLVAQADAQQLSDAQLLEFLQLSNALYRGGAPLISDYLYDSVFLAELQKRDPQHEFLQAVEPELSFAGKTVTLPEHMLSTEKAYSRNAIEKWLARIEKAAQECQVQPENLQFRATPKLDGYAAYDDGHALYTRGDGRKGTDISRVFERGLQVAGNGLRGQGAGEIVVSQSYFNTYLAEYFENSRNFQASIIKEKDLEQHALEAIQNQAALFYPFAQLPNWTGSAADLSSNFSDIVEQVLGFVDFDVDGVVFEVTDEVVKQYLGATRHHHRWQIAFKNNIESAEVQVLSVTPQTSRSGRVNPVAELEPTKLSGALISRATAHHYGMVKELGIGPGTVIELTRSGLVIPKIERVIRPADPQIPEHCPSCGSDLVWDSDYLYCLNSIQCPAQIENSIEHFFRTLANIDGFGQKTIEKLHAAGVGSVYAVYQLTVTQLQDMGFGDKTAQNLLAQLQRSRMEAIEDWRFLGAFGIYRMGLGNCERLLQHHQLLDIFNLTIDDVIAIEGFAEKTGALVVSCLAGIKEDFLRLYELGFNLVETPPAVQQQATLSAIAGKTIVFTGTMQHGKRDDMKKEAKRLGAKVAGSVTGNTDFLVTGTDVGVAKINAASEKGVQVLSEQEYLALMSA